MMRAYSSLLCLTLTLSGFCAAGLDKNTLEELLTPSLIRSVKISPDGKHLALRVFIDGRHILRMVRRDNLKVVGGLDVRLAGERSEVGDFWWGSDSRLIGEIIEAPVGLSSPKNYGELFGVNVDGSKPTVLFGYRAGRFGQGATVRSKKTRSERAWARFLHRYPRDDDHVLISQERYSMKHDEPPKAVLLNIHTGKVKARAVARAQLPKSRFVADQTGEIRMIIGDDVDAKRYVLARFADSQWKALNADGIGNGFTPVSTVVDDQFYALNNQFTDTRSLYRFTTSGDHSELVYQHDLVDLSRVLTSTDLTDVYGLLVYDGLPKYILLDSSHPERALFKTLLSALPGSIVTKVNQSDDGRFWVVYSHSSTDPGSYYLFDTTLRELRLINRTKPEINSSQLSEMRPIEFESIDQRVISGYYTAPLNPESLSPMVVLVHGGPNVRDYWGFNAGVQVLASAGYGVLQINYRGSTGFGAEFQAAANRQWGGDVQADIVAGTKSLIESGKIDPARVCIMGTSFGAYSAVMSATIEPDLFACVIANAGIYDLELLAKTGDMLRRYGGPEYQKRAIGVDTKELRAYSPVNRVSYLKAPVLLAHGKKDKRAPYRHAKALKKALKKNKKRFEVFVRANEGHGFYDTSNRVSFYQRTLEFLDKYAPTGVQLDSKTLTED